MSDNYPCDIRNYDNNPQSPFYVPTKEELFKENRYEELVNGDSELLEEVLSKHSEELWELVLALKDEDQPDTKYLPSLGAIYKLIDTVITKQVNLEWEDKQ